MPALRILSSSSCRERHGVAPLVEAATWWCLQTQAVVVARHTELAGRMGLAVGSLAADILPEVQT
jgi:hypothetical protein